MTNIQGNHNFVRIDEAFSYDSRNLTLVIRQQPKRAQVSGVKDKVGERPVDPPPIVQIKTEDSTCQKNNLLQNPSLFVIATLIGPADVIEESISSFAIHGTISSSLYKLKDVDNSDGGFFIFPEISIRIEGYYRLRFQLYEACSNQAILLKSVDSEVFRVYPAKFFPGMDESTFLSRSFSDQGARIRIRRTSKIMTKGCDMRMQTPMKRGSSFEYFPSKYYCSRSPDSEYDFDDTPDQVKLCQNNPTCISNEHSDKDEFDLRTYDRRIATYSTLGSLTPTSTAFQFTLSHSKTADATHHIDNCSFKTKDTYVCTPCPFEESRSNDGQFFSSLFESYLVRNEIPLFNRNIHI